MTQESKTTLDELLEKFGDMKWSLRRIDNSAYIFSAETDGIKLHFNKFSARQAVECGLAAIGRLQNANPA